MDKKLIARVGPGALASTHQRPAEEADILNENLDPQVHAPDQGRSIRIGGDLLLVKAMTGVEDGVVVLETLAAPGEPAPLDHR